MAFLFPMPSPLSLKHYAAPTDALVHQLLQLILVTKTFCLLSQDLIRSGPLPCIIAPRNITRPNLQFIRLSGTRKVPEVVSFELLALFGMNHSRLSTILFSIKTFSNAGHATVAITQLAWNPEFCQINSSTSYFHNLWALLHVSARSGVVATAIPICRSFL